MIKLAPLQPVKPEVQNVVVAKDYHYILSIPLLQTWNYNPRILLKAIVEHFYISSSLEIETNEIPGRGLEATYEGILYQIGRFESESDPYLEKRADYLQNKVKRLYGFMLTINKLPLFLLKDTIRKEAVEMISYLNTCGVDTLMLTGDQRETAHNIANTVGIKRYIANCFP